MADYYKKAPSVKKTFPKPVPTEQYEHPIGPEKPTEVDRLRGAVSKVTGHPWVQGAYGQLAERSHEIAHEMQESPARERREHRSGTREPHEPLMSGPAFRDPFGVSGYGMGFGPAPEPRAPPRRRKKKRSTTRSPSRSPPMARGNQFLDPFHIPRHMRHMF